MDSRIVWTVLLCWLLVVPLSLAGESEPTRAAADALSAIKAAGTACPPSWSNASVANIERLDLPSGTWHLAHVTAAGRPAGYVLLLEGDAVFVTVMYSASHAPMTTIQHFAASATENPLDVAPLIESLPGVPMIAVPKVRNTLIQVSPLACCISGMSMWLQEHHRIPFLYLPLEVVATTTRPFDLKSPLLLPSPPAAGDDLVPYLERCAKIYLDPELAVPLVTAPTSAPTFFTPPPGTTFGIKDRTLLIERMMPVIRSELLKNLSRAARWELMREELVMAAGMIPEPRSEGMTAAMVVQLYIEKAASLEQGLEDFARSRGLRPSTCAHSQVADLTAHQLPCVFWGPQNQAVLVTGLSSTSGVKWVVVTAAETVQPILLSLEEFEAKIIARFEANKPPGAPKGPVLPPMFQTPEKRKEFDKLKQQSDAIPSGKLRMLDPKSGSPQALAAGAHVARLDLFLGWKVVSVKVEQ
jgi:hypothetical protein